MGTIIVETHDWEDILVGQKNNISEHALFKLSEITHIPQLHWESFWYIIRDWHVFEPVQYLLRDNLAEEETFHNKETIIRWVMFVVGREVWSHEYG